MRTLPFHERHVDRFEMFGDLHGRDFFKPEEVRMFTRLAAHGLARSILREDDETLAVVFAQCIEGWGVVVHGLVSRQAAPRMVLLMKIFRRELDRLPLGTRTWLGPGRPVDARLLQLLGFVRDSERPCRVMGDQLWAVYERRKT